MSLPPNVTPPSGEIKDPKYNAKNTKSRRTNDKNAIMLDIPEDENDTDKTQDEVMVQALKAMKTFEELRSERSPPQPAVLGKVPEAPADKSKSLSAAWAEIEKQEWYHGMIPIEDVKSMLLANGDFLVRKIDNQNLTTPPVLTVLWNDTLFHFPIYGNQKSDGSGMEFTLNTITYCSSYSEIIGLHVYQRLPIFAEIVLLKGVPKQAWELERENVVMEIKIGEGQYGQVWKGVLKTKNGPSINVAIKVMKVNSNTQEQLQMFQKEARLMRVYNHRNVVKLYGIVCSDCDVMVVMELVSGGGLDSYLKKKPLMPLVKASFCYDIAAGLAYLHSNNCMHRDVAARNCLVTQDNRLVKLSDFGLAAHGRRITLTQSDKVPVRWQAPEVLFHHIYMRESDVWSYGMLMSEIYNDGKVPFHDKSFTDIRLRIHDPAFRPTIPHIANYPEIPLIMRKCWSVDVVKRPRMKTIERVLQRYCIHTIKVTESVQAGPKEKFVHCVQTKKSNEKTTETTTSPLLKKDAKKVQLKVSSIESTGHKLVHVTPTRSTGSKNLPTKGSLRNSGGTPLQCTPSMRRKDKKAPK